MSSASPLVRLEAVTKSFARNADDGEPVLNGVDLEIAAADTVAVLGPSGSGKSTLLHIIGTLEPASSGRVLWEGRDVSSLSAGELAAFRNREIGFVFQQHHLLPQCTALENVLVPTLPAGANRADRGSIEQRAGELLDQIGLGARKNHRPGQLSGGERQRVAVVRALINGPRLLLADEPTGSLDAAAAAALGELLSELNESSGVALLTVTHSDRLAERMSRVLRLENGTLVTDSVSQGQR